MVLVVVVEVVYAICVIPENPEVRRCRLQPCKTAHRLIGVGITLWVGVLWNTPDALDGVIRRHQFLHHIHIRTLWSHGNINHLNSKILSDGKMAVISGNGA